MSRRKQAKPRPIFAYEEETGPSEEVFYSIGQSNGHAEDIEEEKDDQEGFDGFTPLVMDTSSHDDDPSTLASLPPSPPSIKSTKRLPLTNAQPVRPEPLKPTVNLGSDGPVFSSTPSKPRLGGVTGDKIPGESLTSVSSSASLVSMGSSADSPQEDRATVQSSPVSAGQTTSMMRRGSKTTDPDTDENDENVIYDSDLDDLEELLSELIKYKILPVSGEDGEKFICPVCNVSLLNLHDLTVHIRSHNTPTSGTQSNTCKICGKVLSSQSSLDRHMLVHSGERPFLCKVCNMSFTTNGNMHRHSRIHTKEENLNALGAKFQMRRGKSAWRQRINSYLNQTNSPVSDRMKTFQSSVTQDILKSLPNHSQQSVFSRPTENLPMLVPGMKRQFSVTEMKSDWQVPVKRQSLSEGEGQDISPHKYEYQILPTKEEQIDTHEENNNMEEKGDKEVLHCPQCPKTFLCKYGLETHMETHPNISSHCGSCNISFENPRKLRLHRLIVHTEKGTEDDKDKGKEDADLKVGFQDLSFVDFSVEKFALIAKHYLEENMRISSSAYLNFTCKTCSKAFPCKSSLILHSYSHTKDKSTQCPLCECDYADVNEFHTHMLKHLADRAFAEIRPSLRDEKGDDLTPDCLTQHDFLAMFQLKEEEDSHPDMKPVQKKELVKPMKVEKSTNNEYFAKLGQTFAAGVPSLFNQFPVFPPGYQPTLDDFHKMLQIATNMNMLPSMGPTLLMKGLNPSTSSPTKVGRSSTDTTPSSSPAPAHSHLASAGLHTKQSSDNTGAGPEKEISDIKMMNSMSFPCKYCDKVFSSYKTLKAHIRTHLGLSPYQCNLCVYASNDKSSLIRHIRTHSGERPFQCLICDFAFTTRANCERHIRKKHAIENKEEVEKSIYSNKFALEGSSIDHFHSPDTVCKYCGVDFKFFRALKNHLRSHNTCKQKPYQCQLCAMSFCAKVNCLRHIQKMHPEINDNQIEFHIKVIESSTMDDGDNDSVSDDGIPLYTDESSSTPQPPAAHSTPKPEGLLGRDGRHVSPNRHRSPNRHMSPMSTLSPSQSPLVIKTEPADDRDEAPLDFSMKQNGEPVDEGMSTKLGKSEETPIDLSVRKTSTPVPIAPKPLPAMILQQLPETGHLLQCIYCPLGFSNLGSLNQHVRQQHPNLPAVENSSLAAHLTAPPQVVNTVTTAPSLPLRQNKGSTVRPIKPKTSATTIQNLQDKIMQNLKRDVPSSPNGSETDLASVKNIINATDPLNFQAFFTSAQAAETNLTSVPSIPATVSSASAKNKPKSRLPNILRRPGVQISLENCRAIARELDNLQREGDVDEDALCQVREMALSVKEECVNNTPTSSTPSIPTVSRTSTSPTPLADLSKDDENSGDGSSSGLKSEGDKESNPVKKKRNSYADSPHKLSCPYCPRAFPWVSSLTRHLLTHTGQKPFKCPRCPVTFSTKSNRERHLIRKHGVNMLDPLSRQTMDRPYKCPLCVFSSFSTQSNLLKHYRDRHNGANLPDNISDIERMSPSAIKAATMEMESRAAEHPPQMDAGMSLATEEDEDELDNSVDSIEKMDEDSIPYTDIEGPEDTGRPGSVSGKSEASVSSQSSFTNKQAADVDSKPAFAPHLQMTFPDKKASETYVTSESEEDKERKRTPSPETMKRNIERIIAEQKALIEQKSQMEMKIQDEIRSQIEAQKKSDDTSDLLDSPKLMIDLIKPFTGSAERIINPERDNYDVDKIVECWKCKEIFPSRKSLVRHLKEHNIDLPFKCYLCDASYDHRVDCLEHQNEAHRSDWKILKDKNKVGDIPQFAVHMDKVVENNCNKLDSGSLLEIPGSGNDESKMEVISADYMQRKVYCSLCPKRFWSLQDLRRHMRSHTGERPFECDICQKRFTLKHSMMRHRKKHAGAPPRTFEDDEDSNGVEEKVTKSTPSRNMAIYPYPGSLSLNDQAMTIGSSYMFNHGLSGGRLTLGGSTIGNLTSATINGSAETATTSSSNQDEEPKASEAETLASVKKEFLDCNADMLHNLLGVESSAIEKLLDSADSKSAAKFLGIQEVSN